MPLINDNNLQQALAEFKDKLSVAPIYVDPMDVKDKHTVEYHTMRLSENITLASNNSTTPVKVRFNTLSVTTDGTKVNTSNNTIHLTAKKTYRISVSLGLYSAARTVYAVFRADTNTPISDGAVASGSNNSEGYNDSHLYSIYTPDVDMDVYVGATWTIASTVLHSGFSYFTVEEIAQPVVVEYNKEISNPLTTEPLEMLQIDYVASSAVTANTYINLSSANIVYSNMIIENGFIKLTAGKLYKINFDKAGAVNVAGGGNFTIYLCDDDNNTISLLSPATPATNTTNRASSVSGTVLYTPTVDTYVSILSNVNLSSLFFTLTVEEVRNNPVNQYGGFQQQTLWAGELSTISSPVTLSDSVNNYSHIYVTSVCDTETSTSVYSRTEPIIVENIELSKNSGLANNFFKNPTNYYNIAYEFVDNTTFQINEIDNAGFLNPRITKIVGVYGQLPSLIMGGEF